MKIEYIALVIIVLMWIIYSVAAFNHYIAPQWDFLPWKIKYDPASSIEKHVP